jgi:hypothetical protein
MKSESLRVNVSEDIKAKIVAEAEEHEVSEAQVVRWALRDYFNRKESKS